jgi:hypothetical protein
MTDKQPHRRKGAATDSPRLPDGVMKRGRAWSYVIRVRDPAPGVSELGAAYRNRTDDLRITRGLLPRSHSMTCTDSTTNGSEGPDCTGISRHPVPRLVPRLSHPPRLAAVVSSL